MQSTDGLIWVVWFSNRTGNYELFYKKYNGSAWSTETPLTNDPSPDKYPSIMQANDGTIWVVWSSYRTQNQNYELFYKTFNGTTWTSDNPLTSDPAFDMAPSIAKARDRTIWVVWQSDRPSEKQEDLYYKIYNGSAWSVDQQLTSDLADDIASSIAQIDDRKIWVVWTADRDDDFDIYCKTSSEIIVHDVAITSVSPYATTVNQGDIVSVSVIAENQGDNDETFNVNCYANTTSIGRFTSITLLNGTSTTLTFEWNTSVIACGRYSISATASVVSGENPINTVDNTFRDGLVQVKLKGDVNGDGSVDASDLFDLSRAFGSNSNEPNWNPNCDFNRDGKIDPLDLFDLSKNYGKLGF